MDDLKSCPFCGDPMIVSSDGTLRHANFERACLIKWQMWDVTFSDRYLDEWNTRANSDVVEALREAMDLIVEAKGLSDGPCGGAVTDHLDAAENWILKARAALGEGE